MSGTPVLPAAEIPVPGGGVHPGGWYRLEVWLAFGGGEAGRPRLQVEHQAGGGEDITLPPPDPEGRIRAVVRLRADAAVLRFVASGRFGGLVLRSVSLRPLGKGAALALTLRQQVATQGTGAVLSCIGAILATAGRSGLRAAGDLAYDAYQQCLAPGTDYASWIRQYDATPDPANPALAAAVRALPRQPQVSILLPVYETDARWLRACLDSVLAQAYPAWECCIVDDASSSSHVWAIVQSYCRRDARFKARRRPANGHISQATNDALAMASGEWVALLDHDDVLPPHALLEMVGAALANPRWRMLYSDEDKIDAAGRRYDPYFKPDYAPTLLLGQNCISHFGMYATALVRDVGGFRTGYEGSQDWDLALRCVERLDSGQVGHVPRILYHWRAIPGSTAASSDAKDYATDAALRAVSDHLQRTGEPATAEVLEPGRIRVRWALPRPAPRVSLIIPTRDRADLLRTCVRSLRERTAYPDVELLVVDNQSTEPEALAYLAELDALPGVRVLRHDAPFNYSAINNAAARVARGEVLGLVNNDIEAISPGWLEEMVAQAVRPGVGAVGAMLLYPDDRIQHAGVILGLNGVAGHAYVGEPRTAAGQVGRLRLAQELSAVTAACLVVRKAVFDDVGGLDEGLAVAFNDIDLCLRIRAAGYRNVWTPHAVLYHHESASRGYDVTPEKQARLAREAAFMQARWGDLIEADPAYNPNLALQGRAFELAFPPRHR